MKTKIIKTQTVAKTSYSMRAKIVTLNQAPTAKEAKEFFGNNEAIVLEF